MASIITHDGSFHADEALACFMLHKTATFANAPITRTRNPDLIAKGTIVVDVGGEYNAELNRFDHHQRSFTDTFSPKYSTKLSSAGLIYKHFGREVIASILEWPQTDERLETVYQKVYKDFIESMDGVDNGVNQFDGGKQMFINITSIGNRVGRLNPRWNETNVDVDARFATAMAITGEELVNITRNIGCSWLPARSIVEEAMDARDESAPVNGRVIVLPRFCPWAEHIFDIETERGIPEDRRAVYVLYSDKDSWRIQAVPIRPGAFENRKALPEPWRGLRDEELSKVSGIPGCIFAHATGFIGGNKTREGALQMAQAALLFQ